MQSKLNKYYYVNGSSAYKYDNYEIESYYNKKALNDERIKKERIKLKMKARVRAVGIILLTSYLERDYRVSQAVGVTV